MSNKEVKFKVEETKLMKLFVRALRYALTRNNHIEPSLTIEELTEYLKQLGKTNKDYWYKFFLDEVESFERFYYDKPFDEYNTSKIENFKEFLKGNTNHE